MQADSAASEAGLEAGDRVREANGQKVDRFQDLQKIVRMTVGEPVTLVVERGGANRQLVAHPRVREVKDVLGKFA